jgi:hypothetical protein
MIEQAHLLIRPVHSIAELPSPILAGASHCRATKSYLGRRIPSPAPPYLILAGASLPRHHSILVSASLLRRHSISSGASLPHCNFYPGQRIIVAPPFYLGRRIITVPRFLSWLAHHCRTAISISAGASLPCHHSVLASTSLPRRNFHFCRHIIAALPYPIMASASLPCATI